MCSILTFAAVPVADASYSLTESNNVKKTKVLIGKIGTLLLIALVFALVGNALAQDVLSIRQIGESVKITWSAVEGADSYNIFHGATRLAVKAATQPIATLKVTDLTPEAGFGEQIVFSFTHSDANAGRFENYYRVVPVVGDASGKEQMISVENITFGDNMLFYDAKYDSSGAIADDVNKIHSNDTFKGEFTKSRYGMNFKPGEYKDFRELRIGFYTSFSGLGSLPTETKFFGSLATPPHLDGNNATCTFWRSTENLEISKVAGDDGYFKFLWAVSQAAPARRLSVGSEAVFDWGYGWASGGFTADCRFSNKVGSVSQQQWYSRSCDFVNEEFSGVNWNLVIHGAAGKTFATDVETGGHKTNIPEVAVIREKPFLYLAEDGYKVFVPALRKNTKGITWNDVTKDMGKGKVLDIDNEFHVTKVGDTAATINTQLAAGKHIFFTPGMYELEVPIHVTRAETVLLGTGYATLIPGKENEEGAMLVDDVPGVTVASLMFDAHYNSKYLLRVGPTGADKDHSANPTLLADIFCRVGGFKPEKVHVDVSLQVNSNNVIGDHFWIWRADHGAGVGWDQNTAPFGVIVSGNDVTIHGLLVEHYQKYQTYWLGERGKMYFYQNELPYDPPNQAQWMSHDGKVNGWSAYKVANNVKEHYAVGLGCYGVFNKQAPGVIVVLANAVEVPNTPGVRMDHVAITELGGRGGITSAINGTGESVGKRADGSEAAPTANFRRVISYSGGIGTVRRGNANVEEKGIPLGDETLEIQK